MITVWITKYLFTKGLYAVEVEKVTITTVRNPALLHQYFHGNDWWHSREEAVAHAKRMIAKKKTAIAKELKKISELEEKL
jgi:hypothetical protein